MTTLYFYVSFALFISFLCSLLEAVLLTVTPSYINLLVKQDRRGACSLKIIKEKIDKPLIAILTLNTIANTVGAAGVGATVLNLFGNVWVAFASGLLTLSILIFSEIIPKNLGASYWRNLALPSAIIIRWLVIITLPLTLVLQKISTLVRRPEKEDQTMSREELLVAAETGSKEGILAEKEMHVIKNLLSLNVILAEDVMTPRSVVLALHQETTVGNAMKGNAYYLFSRIPVYDKNIDDIIGVALRYRILEKIANDEHEAKIGELMIPAHSVSNKTPIAKILDEFIRLKEHLFIVTDGVGSTTGIITLEDCIETLLGVEIVDEFDSVEDMRKHALEKFEQRKKTRSYRYHKKPGQMSE